MIYGNCCNISTAEISKCQVVISSGPTAQPTTNLETLNKGRGLVPVPQEESHGDFRENAMPDKCLTRDGLLTQTKLTSGLESSQSRRNNIHTVTAHPIGDPM